MQQQVVNLDLKTEPRLGMDWLSLSLNLGVGGEGQESGSTFLF